ncbi:unnamed protein product [Amaranthus hypochondriacus]
MEWNYLNNTQITDFSPLDDSFGSYDLQFSNLFLIQDYGHDEQQTMDFQQTQSFGCHGNEFFDIGESSNIQNEGENSNRESIRNIKEKKGRIAFRMKSEMDVVDDGYKWRKYGKKMVKNSPNPRNYYRCAVDGCPVKKRVERDRDDMNYVITTYEANHNHQSQIELFKIDPMIR